MRQSTRLIVNSLSMFGRMGITIGISLLITRLLLQTLGKVDFGLVLALGATGAMLQFVSAALTTGMQRQLSCEIARKDTQALSRAFSTGWVIYMALGTGLWLVGVGLTPAIMNVLTIPPDRADAAWWVYQVSLLNLVLVVTATPYQALIVSHQHLTIQAVADVVTVLTRLAAVLLVLIVPWDRMVAFVAFQLAGYAAVRWALNVYCLWRYEGSWPRPRNFDTGQLKQIFGIAMWALLSNLSWRLKMQGGILLLNIFFGPAVNAAYGIAVQVAGYALTMANAIRVTVLPAIVGAHTKGNRQIVHRLALATGKYTVLLMSLLFVPLWFEAEQALRFWLSDLLPYTVILTRLTIIGMLAGIFITGYMLANVATGDLGWYTKRLLLGSVLSLITTSIGFFLGLPPWFLPLTAIFGSIAMMLVGVVGLGARIELPISRWAYESLLPTLGVLLPAILAAGTVHSTMPEGVWRLLAVAGAYVLVAAPLTWAVGLAAWERERFLGFAGSAMARFQRTLRARSRP